jgi:hypothetical protein
LFIGARKAKKSGKIRLASLIKSREFLRRAVLKVLFIKIRKEE